MCRVLIMKRGVILRLGSKLTPHGTSEWPKEKPTLLNLYPQLSFYLRSKTLTIKIAFVMSPLHRRQFLQTSSFAIGSTLLPAAWLQQLLAPAGEMKTLRNNVGIFTERGGTIAWMIDKEGLVVVDTQFPDTAGHLIEEIRKQSQRRVDLLVNTHHHGDHSGGNIVFKDIVNKVVAHKNSRANQERVAIGAKTEDKQLYPDTTAEKIAVLADETRTPAALASLVKALDLPTDRKSTRLNSSHSTLSRMPSSA